MPAADTLSPAARPPKLYLASRSPRRRELLAGAGIEHEPIATGVDDADLTPGAVTPAQWAAALAYLKARAGVDAARAAAGGGRRAFTVLGADTICVKDGEMIGQPRDAADARRILRLLSAGGHEVVTGVAIVSTADAGRDIFIDRAGVRVGDLGEARIDRYVASGRWRGKAGAYNLAERLADDWPIEYDGDPATIMGLPMRALTRRLAGRTPHAEAPSAPAIGSGP